MTQKPLTKRQKLTKPKTIEPFCFISAKNHLQLNHFMINRVSFLSLFLSAAALVNSPGGFAFSQTATSGQTTKESLNTEVDVDVLQLEESAVKAAVEQVAASVVQIETIGGSADDAGVSTGTVVSADGLVLTAEYNLRHEPSSIFIQAYTSASDEPERLIAELIATDHSRNLSLLKVDLPPDAKLVPVVAAAKASLKVGSTTIAVGKVYDAAATSISVGILSATDRIWGRAIQTDAKISRTNYGGPLINFSGQTIGILVPLSPDDSDVEAGAQWYDSGIGFAVPLDTYYKSIDRMVKSGDLDQGLLGVTLTAKDIYADVPKIELCSPKSPATLCGLLPGDTIVAVDGFPVISQSQMKHVTGPKYAGDEITLTVLRGDQEQSFTATLVDRIDPFVELAIGVIPDRSSKNKSAKIAQVLPDSPDAKTRLAPGDIISAIKSDEVKTWDDFQSKINQLELEADIEIVVRNESEANRSAAETKRVSLVPLSASMPPNPVDEVSDESNETEAETVARWELVEVAIKVTSSANRCTAYIPRRKLPQGGKDDSERPLFVWVAPPGIADTEKIREAVEPIVTERGMAVIVPQSLNPQGWSSEETKFIVKAIGKLKKRVAIDDNRIAIGGEATAAKMSSLTAFLHRETFRGLIMYNSLFPGRIPKIETRPDQRLMILMATDANFANISKLEKMKTVIEKRKFPLYHLSDVDETFAEFLPQIARWVEALDRH